MRWAVVFYQMLTGELPGKKIAPPSRKFTLTCADEIVWRRWKKIPDSATSKSAK